MSESPRTDDYYGVPVYTHDGITTMQLTAGPSVNEVEFIADTHLHFYSELSPSSTLFVAFHGAMREGKDCYPRFERVSSLKRRSSTFISFADPTWHLNTEMQLSWFLGGPAWDALDPIEGVIRRALLFTGASRVVFVGGSGGGFAALRASLRFPGSLAYVQSPQTVITRYVPSVVEMYFASVWGKDKHEVASSLPHRFDLVALYAANPGINHVYYLQNLNDPVHIRDHYKPFKRMSGINEVHGTGRDGTRRLYLSDSDLLRHGPPTPAEFEQNFDRALRFFDNTTSNVHSRDSRNGGPRWHGLLRAIKVWLVFWR